jgi:hypothetical protein
MSHSNTTLATPHTVEPGVVPGGATAVATAEPGVVAAGIEPSAGSLPAGVTTQAASIPETGAVANSEPGVVAAGAQLSAGSLPAGSTAQMAGIPNSNPSAERPAKSGVVPAANCGCGNGNKSNVFAIGLVGFDFGTEARRDSFRQLMQGAVGEDGKPLFDLDPGGNPSANPYNPLQLSKYLGRYHSESAKLIWTLNLDLSPIYAIEAEVAYADEIYNELREALNGEALPIDNPYYRSSTVSGILF